MKISFFILWALMLAGQFLAATAFASSYPLEIMPKAECVSALQAIQNPEATVASGLATLESINEAKKNAENCLPELLHDWNTFFPTNDSAPLPPSKFQQALNGVWKHLKCFTAYEDPACEGKSLTKEEKQALTDKKSHIEQSISILPKVPGAFEANLNEERKRLNRESTKTLFCVPNPYAEGTPSYNSFQDNLLIYCDGRAFSPDEMAAQENLVNKLRRELGPKLATADELLKKLKAIFGPGQPGDPVYPADPVYERIDTILPAAKTLVCTSPYPEGSSAYESWKYNGPGFCESKFGGSADFPEAQAKLLEALGNIDELKAKVEANLKDRQEKLRAFQAAAQKLQYRSYGYRRLYAFFERHLKSGGSDEALDEFCGQYESGLAREKKFFEASLPGGARIGFNEFNSYTWTLARKYGLTEAEYIILSAYIGNFYQTINGLLYTKNITPAVELYRDMLNSALDKFPVYSGEPLLRFSTLPESVLKKHQAGEIVTYDAFTSTSKKKNWNWNGGGNARFLIYNGKSGRDISLDINPGEGEVLFKSGTRFKVIAKEKKGTSTSFVLVEVDDKGAPMASLAPPAEEYAP